MIDQRVGHGNACGGWRSGMDAEGRGSSTGMDAEDGGPGTRRDEGGGSGTEDSVGGREGGRNVKVVTTTRPTWCTINAHPALLHTNTVLINTVP